jgi:DNA-binding HxlR family transcriptional regulator
MLELLSMDLNSCPVKITADVVSGKWKPLIIVCLKTGPQRYGELRRKISGPTHKVLTQQLRQLEGDGIVTRKVYATVPPRVEYSLSRYGKTLVPVLDAMAQWGIRHSSAKSNGQRPHPSTRD